MVKKKLAKTTVVSNFTGRKYTVRVVENEDGRIDIRVQEGNDKFAFGVALDLDYGEFRAMVWPRLGSPMADEYMIAKEDDIEESE